MREGEGGREEEKKTESEEGVERSRLEEGEGEEMEEKRMGGRQGEKKREGERETLL